MTSGELTTIDLLLNEQRVTNEGPSMGVPYLLCILLGTFSAHRFYLGRHKSGFLQLASWLILVHPLWEFVDLFLIPGMVRADQNAIRLRYLSRLNPLPAITNR